MSKKSRQFQKLVTFIAEQVASLGATVQEYAELNEKGIISSIMREALERVWLKDDVERNRMLARRLLKVMARRS